MKTGDVVECVEHDGTHKGFLAADFGDTVGMAWGLNQVLANRVHARDGVSCPKNRVRPVGPMNRQDEQNLDLIRAAANAGRTRG